MHLGQLDDRVVTLIHLEFQPVPLGFVLGDPDARAGVQDMIDQLIQLRARCQRYTSSFVTPMGDEMFYRYQEALIDDLLATLGALYRSSSSARAKQSLRDI